MKDVLEGFAGVWKMAFDLIGQIPIEVLDRAIDRISTQEAIGPLLHPTSYVRSKRSQMETGSKEFLMKVRELRELQEEWKKKISPEDAEQAYRAIGVNPNGE